MTRAERDRLDRIEQQLEQITGLLVDAVGLEVDQLKLIRELLGGPAGQRLPAAARHDASKRSHLRLVGSEN